MKKSLVLFLVLFIILGLTTYVYADEDNLEFTASKTTLEVGDTVTITFKTKEKVSAVDTDISFSKDILEFDSTTIDEDYYSVLDGIFRICYAKNSGTDTFEITFKAKKEGTVTLQTKTENLNTDVSSSSKLKFTEKNITITVKAKSEEEPKSVAVTNIKLNSTSGTIKVGETITLKAIVEPENATNKTVTWKSSDETIATVNNGVVKAIKEGEVTITATADGKSAVYLLKVEKKVTEEKKENEGNKKSEEKNNEPQNTQNVEKSEIHNSNETKQQTSDNTISKQALPNTGKKITILFLIIVITGLAVISGVKYMKYFDI